MDVKFSAKKLIAIEYPGTVLNLNNMTKTFGGENEMWSTFNHTTRRLELKFRPDDAHCKCVYGDRHKTTNLLLKIIKRTKKRSENSDPLKEPKTTYTMEFLGVASTSYKFQSLADFQVLPIVFDRQQNEYKSLLPDIVPTALHPVSWLNQDVELFISPLMFSRFDVPQSGYLETNKSKTSSYNRALPENIIGKCRKRRAGFAVFLTFESKETPEKAQDIALKQLETYPLDLEIKFKVDDYFKERPIWSKNALMYRLGCEKARLKYSLPCSAYYFNNGPWRTLWTKFGYDPRKNPESKQYQVMDLRINPNIPLNEHKIAPRNKNLANRTSNVQRSATIDPSFLVPSVSGESMPDNVELNTRLLLCEYYPGQLPPARQCFYQLCDIHLQSVQELVHQNDGHEESCHEKDGWCELGTLEKCRELIIADIIKTNKLKEELEKNIE